MRTVSAVGEPTGHTSLTWSASWRRASGSAANSSALRDVSRRWRQGPNLGRYGPEAELRPGGLPQGRRRRKADCGADQSQPFHPPQEHPGVRVRGRKRQAARNLPGLNRRFGNRVPTGPVRPPAVRKTRGRRSNRPSRPRSSQGRRLTTASCTERQYADRRHGDGPGRGSRPA